MENENIVTPLESPISEESIGQPNILTQSSTPPTSQQVQQKVVSKELFDKTSSELAQLKKQLKEAENKGKTAEQLKQDELAEKEAKLLEIENKLKESTLKTNKATVASLTAEVKAKIALDPKTTEFTELIDILVNEDETITTKNATTFSNLLAKVYEAGFNSANANKWNSMSNGVKNGTSTNNSASYGARAAEFSKVQDTDNVKNLYK